MQKSNRLHGIETMAYPLPEDIALRKFAGDLEGARKLIDIYISENRAPLLNERLILEKQILDRLPSNYPYTHLQAIAIAQAAIPGFTDMEFDACEDCGDIAYIYISGQKRYFSDFLDSLFKLQPKIAERAGHKPPRAKPLLDEAIASLKRLGEKKYRIHMRASLLIADGAFAPGVYRAHLPLPARTAQQSETELLSASEGLKDVEGEQSPARTAYFERRMARNEPFTVEYSYLSHVKYFDMNMPAPAQPLYPAAPAPTPEDLSELPGHILFTPYLRALAEEICGGEAEPLKKARLIYDYITTHVRYSFMREYFLLPDISEYAALGLKGDCGVQALLFITLCRIAGIPARWQSGLFAQPGDVGSHDWAQFYVVGWGWLFCDPSFGGSAQRAGAIERWNFYFGNLDPYRMAANSRYQAEFIPPKRFARVDPYDNQSGECESETRALLSGELNCAREVISASEEPIYRHA